MKLKKEDVNLFLRAATTTLVALLCLTIIYLGICRAYEQMRETCFADDRAAVILGDGYIKFFDNEIFY